MAVAGGPCSHKGWSSHNSRYQLIELDAKYHPSRLIKELSECRRKMKRMYSERHLHGKHQKEGENQL